MVQHMGELKYEMTQKNPKSYPICSKPIIQQTEHIFKDILNTSVWLTVGPACYNFVIKTFLNSYMLLHYLRSQRISLSGYFHVAVKSENLASRVPEVHFLHRKVTDSESGAFPTLEWTVVTSTQMDIHKEIKTSLKPFGSWRTKTLVIYLFIRRRVS